MTESLRQYNIQQYYGGSSFIIEVWDGSHFVAKHTFSRHLDDYPLLPSTAKNILDSTHVNKWESGIDVSKRYKGLKLGETLWKYSEMQLLEIERPIIRYIKDDSPNNWTENHIWDVIESLEQSGVNTQLLWSGSVEDRNAFIFLFS